MIYIAIEGMSGSGKTTLMNEGLRTWMQEFFKTKKLLFIEEPFATTRDMTLNILENLCKLSSDLDVNSKFYMLLAARARLFHYHIANYAKEVGSDKLVVVGESSMLRFMVTHRALMPLQASFQLCRNAQGGALPNIVLFLDPPPELINARTGGAVGSPKIQTIAEVQKAYHEALGILYGESQQKAKIQVHPCIVQPGVEMPVRNLVADCIEIIKQSI